MELPVLYEFKHKGNIEIPIHWIILKYPTKSPSIDIIKSYGFTTVSDYCKYMTHPVSSHLFYKHATCWFEEQITIKLEKHIF